MHAKRQAPKRAANRAAPANPRNDGRITEQQHDEAINTLRAEYYQGVRSIAEDLARAVKDGEIKNQDDWETRIHQEVDGSHWIIYAHANFQVLMCSDNHDAYVEDFGEPPISNNEINWAALAFQAMDHDVRQQLAAEGTEPDWSSLEEVHPREMRASKTAYGEVVPSVRWKNRRTGATASLYGAVPWTSDRERHDWEKENVGWTIANPNGTIGMGRAPFATRAEAEAWLDRETERRESIRRTAPTRPPEKRSRARRR
jgi:hypothetical protein